MAGFLIGLALAESPSPIAPITVSLFTAVGAVFVNLIRMTAIPLVASMLVASIGGLTESARLGRTGLIALCIAISLLAAAAIASVVVAEPILAHVRIDPAAALALRGSLAGAPQAVAPHAPGAAQWVVSLVAPNIVKAVVDDAILPVILFAVIVGLALTRITKSGRDPVLRFVSGVAATMQRLVAGIIQLAPFGVCALAVPLAARLGLSAASAVFIYVVLVVALTVAAVALLLYPLGIALGPMSASAFVAYCAPSQTIALASRSSLAALPVILESAEAARLPPDSSRIVLPIAVSMFHFGAAVAQTVGVLFLARLFGVALTPAQLASVVLAVILASFAVPGVPGGSIIAMVPVLTAANLPIEGVGILLAVDTIPDMFRTTANLTGAMTLAAILPAPDFTETVLGVGNASGEVAQACRNR